jgi:phosphonate metabolism-associated iron-containing alcohol dehydrogenase
MAVPRVWTYNNPVKILFGPGRLEDVGTVVHGRPLLVTSPGASRRGLSGRVMDMLGDRGAVLYDRVQSNPRIDDVERAIRELSGERIQTVVGIGGGSAIDVAKTLGLCLAAPELSLRAGLAGPTRLDDVESLPVVAIPTTAGTGSEVTPFATLWDGVTRRKHSLSMPRLFPKAAILDPDLTRTLSWHDTLSSGLDAYCQCFESIWNRNATPLTMAIAERGLVRPPAALRCLRADQAAPAARADMLESSLLSGLAISHTRTALCHSMSYPLTAHFGLPHGLACAMTLPAVLAFNLEADDGRLEELGRRNQLTGKQGLVASTLDLLRELDVPGAVRAHLTEFGRVYDLATEMLAPGRADNNLREATVDDVRSILRTTEDWLFR